MARQLIALEFNEGGKRYTYHNDGEPVSVGDAVRLGTGRGTVVAVDVEAPKSGETKPIDGLA